jgi:hypothetical protein
MGNVNAVQCIIVAGASFVSGVSAALTGFGLAILFQIILLHFGPAGLQLDNVGDLKTNVAVIVCLSVVSSTVLGLRPALKRPADVLWNVALGLELGIVPCLAVGTYALKNLDAEILKHIVGVVFLFTSIFILSRAVLMRSSEYNVLLRRVSAIPFSLSPLQPEQIEDHVKQLNDCDSNDVDSEAAPIIALERDGGGDEDGDDVDARDEDGDDDDDNDDVDANVRCKFSKSCLCRDVIYEGLIKRPRLAFTLCFVGWYVVRAPY